MFKVWPNKQIPSFEAFMTCTSISDIANLSSNPSFMKDNMLEAQAILPPVLADTLFDMDSYKADEILLKFIHKIRSLKHPSSEQIPADEPMDEHSPDTPLDTHTSEESSYIHMDEADLANMRLEEAPNNTTLAVNQTAENVPQEIIPTPAPLEDTQQATHHQTFDTADNQFESRFGRILEFLWGVTYEDKVVKPTKITPCSTPSVSAWLDTTHAKFLVTHHQPQLPPFLPPQPAAAYPDTSGLSNVATAMTKLSHEMARKNEMEMVSKQESEKKKSEKAFENLSDVQKNIFTYITATSEATDEDGDDLRPTAYVLTLLSQKINIKAQAQLQHLFKETNNICDISLSMCTQLKNGTIASHPSVNDLNGVSPLFLPERSDEERVTQELALRLEEQMVLGKISDSDLKIITKCRFHFPNNFGEYQHCIRNFVRLLEILSGPDSVLVHRVKVLVSHSIRHERSYKEIEHDHLFFYASLLQYIHRRTQHYIHSASHGSVSKLKTGNLSFSDLLEDIEDGDYVPIQPKWLKQNKKSIRDHPNDPPSHNPTGGAGSNNRPKKKSRESVDNDNIVAELKCPANLAYREVFHPANRRGIPEVPHADGSVRCNNWFHRGWCTKECTLKASHSKPLSPDEQTKCKEYLQKLIEKQRRWANTNRRGNNNQGREQGQ